MLTSPDGNGILFLFWKVKALAKEKDTVDSGK